MKSKYILIVAFIMAIITAVLFRQYVVGIDKKYKASQKIVSIVVPKVNIQKNQLVTKEMLEMKEFSAGSIHPDALKKISDVAGKYATTDMKIGEVLFASRFTDQFKEDKLITRKIQDGYRALSIAVTDVKAVTKMIQPEDYVDVVSTANGQTNIILSNVRVLAVGKRLTETELNSKDNNADYGTVTLELSPGDAVKIINSDETGNIKFILRGQLKPTN
ncbi:MAG: Flp pilus assembly protein CpaB [Solirubrobacterales bacterium]